MKPSSWKREWLAAFIIAFVTASILILPYVIGHMNGRPGIVFTGIVVNLEDGTYLSAIEQGRAGAWLYRSYFTIEAHEPVFLEGYYMMLGHVARTVGVSAVAMWHLGLFISNVVLFLTIFGFIGLFLQPVRQRFTAYLLALFGAGFDWWVFPVWFERAAAAEVVPIDLKFPEAHIFYSALTFPHFVAGITLILLVLGLVFIMLVRPVGNRGGWLLAAGAGAANLLLGVVYPFLIVLPAAVLGCFYLYILGRRYRAGGGRSAGQLIDWAEIGRLALVFAIPLPLYLYYADVFLGSDFLRSWSDQAYTPSPNPVHYLLTYGLYLFLGLLYVLKGRGKSGRLSDSEQRPEIGAETVDFRVKMVFLWVWVGAVAVLLYLPLHSQRRYVEGLQVPLAIVATAGFFAVLWPWLVQTRLFRALLKRPRYTVAGMQRLAVVALIGLAGLANVYLYSSTLIKLAVQRPYPLFRPAAELEAMDWLKERLEPGEVVLAGYRTGSFLPYRSGATVIVGNRYETVDFDRKRQEAAVFFDGGTTDGWRRNLLALDGVRYVFVGPEERRLGGESLAGADYLEQIYQSEQVIIYRVQESTSLSE